MVVSSLPIIDISMHMQCNALAGRIWLDNVDCSFADRFEDCSHNGWGIHNCGSSEAIGLICNPGPSGTVFYATVMQL